MQMKRPRYSARIGLVLLGALLLFDSLPATAQNAAQTVDSDDKPELTVKEMIERARQRTTAIKPRPKCPEQDPDDDVVVVCAQIEDGAKYRVPPSTTSRAAMGGPPPAPDVAGPGIFKGKATVGGLCFVPPCPKPPAYIVDFSKLPEFDHEYAAKAREAARLERERQAAQASETDEEAAQVEKSAPQ
ncbi:hypothetical protein [Alterisphingorhabdus coralli]|uniref:Uncharacterized protein n=1 Tax=Alterisphingorhabdus coralli TaxID=3071408 RepID=A0AA97F5H1_9SPHN|nr:hypothetical protein [Parasphingorhabdus sp. SCSIO 66989]WOE74561.1 hypothetical protein RB602_11990 [Parasphingorhabdus sp. SCSIO 66989]